MFRQPESNPHFLPRRNNDPTIDFPTQTPPPHQRHVEPPHGPRPTNPHFPPRHNNDPIIEFPPPHQRHSEPPHGPRSTNPHFLPRHNNNDSTIDFPTQTPPNRHLEPPHGPKPQRHPPYTKSSQPRRTSESANPQQPSGIDHHHHHHHRPPYLHGPTSRPTKPIAWLVAAFCALFWIIIIVGGLIVLIVYLLFRPRSPWFDISNVTINAAYLDMGYLLNADVTVLANFTNPNTKVNVDFNYVVFDLYFQNKVIATQYVEPFSVRKRESHFTTAHMVSSQVRLPMEQSVGLHKQIEKGRVRFEIRGIFRTRSKLGAIFHYSYWLYAHCEVLLSSPHTGVLLRKRCITKR